MIYKRTIENFIPISEFDIKYEAISLLLFHSFAN